MKNFTRLFAVASLLIIFAVTAQAQVTDNSTATATIIAPIGIDKQVDLNFGNLSVSGTQGVVTLEPTSAALRSQVGGVTFPAVAGTVTAAEFAISGVPESTYSILLPSTDLVITNTTGTGGETMIVNNFTSTPTPTGELNLSGTETLYVGADVTVAANQQSGVYVSAVPFDVTVNYN